MDMFLVYKNATDAELLGCVEKSLAFDYGDYQEYQSELSHRMKTYGADFVTLYSSDEEYAFALSLGEHCALYLHTLIKYLCTKHGVGFETLPISKYHPKPMEFLLLLKGTASEYEVLKDLECVREDLSMAIQEFLNVGLIVLYETLYGAV